MIRHNTSALHRWVLHSLHSRLVIGISLGWLVLIASIVLVSSRSGDHLAREVNREHLEYEAALIAQHLEEAIAIRISALEHFAERASLGLPELAFVDSTELLEKNTALLALFDALAVISADGEVMADWPYLEGRRGMHVDDREYFSFLRHVRRPYVSEPFTGAASDVPMVMVAVPLLGPDRTFAGMVGGVMSLEHGDLFSSLQRIRIGNGGFVALATSSGYLLYHPNKNLLMRRVPSVDMLPALDLAMYGWEGTVDGHLIDGTRALQAYRQVWVADWVVGVYLPHEQMIGPIRTFLRHQQWLGALLTLLMLPLLWWLLRLLLRPLHRLEQQIARVGQGEAERVDLDTDMHELQQVARAFNELEQQRGRAKALLQDRQAFLDAVLDSSPTGLFVCNLKGHIVYLNPALESLTGYTLDDYRDGAIRDHLYADEASDIGDLWRHTLQSGHPFARQIRYLTANGQTLWLDLHVSLVSDDEQPLGYVGSVKDITDSRQREALQRWEAEHDPLTGLLNRRGFERRLEEALVEWRKAGTPSVLLMFDLDHFKPINDEGGHALGDEMLRRVAQVVAWEVRRSDHVARQGGDEFAVLMPSCTLNQARRVADTVRQAVSEVSVTHADKEYHVTLSLGMTGFADSDQEIEDVMARADAACYQAKAGGRDRIVEAAVEDVEYDAFE